MSKRTIGGAVAVSDFIGDINVLFEGAAPIDLRTKDRDTSEIRLIVRIINDATQNRIESESNSNILNSFLKPAGIKREELIRQVENSIKELPEGSERNYFRFLNNILMTKYSETLKINDLNQLQRLFMNVGTFINTTKKRPKMESVKNYLAAMNHPIDSFLSRLAEGAKGKLAMAGISALFVASVFHNQIYDTLMKENVPQIDPAQAVLLGTFQRAGFDPSGLNNRQTTLNLEQNGVSIMVSSSGPVDGLSSEITSYTIGKVSDIKAELGGLFSIYVTSNPIIGPSEENFNVRIESMGKGSVVVADNLTEYTIDTKTANELRSELHNIFITEFVNNNGQLLLEGSIVDKERAYKEYVTFVFERLNDTILDNGIKISSPESLLVGLRTMSAYLRGEQLKLSPLDRVPERAKINDPKILKELGW